MRSIILVAPPAAGKGTQSSLLCEKYGLVHISTGDLIREAIKKNDEMSEYLNSQIASGKLVSDDIILKLLGSKLEEMNGAGYILDGFPRTVNQAKEYDKLLETMNESVTCVIYLSVSEELAQKRIVGRISCPKCGRVYNELIEENQPKEADICDECQVALEKRADDNAETFKVRFETYQEQTAPLIEYYKEQNILYEVDSTLPTNEVFKQIESVVDSLMITIKSEHEIELMQKAGEIVGNTHHYLEQFIRPGITTKELNDLAEDFIIKSGATPSFKNLYGFPGTICISINDEVVHGIPSKRKLKNGDIVKLDIGACYHGYHGDSAWSYPVGTVSPEVSRLLQETEEALYQGLSVVHEGAHVGDIGYAIETYAKSHKLGVVKELVGHGIGTQVHEDPDVPNFGKQGTGPELKEGMTIAVEPMLDLGTAQVFILDDDWTIVTGDELPSAHFEHTILVTKDGYQILTKR